VRQLGKAVSDTHLLSPKYYQLNSIVGVTGCLLGIATFCVLGTLLVSSGNAPSLGDKSVNALGVVIIAAMLISLALLIYIGCVLVALCCAALLVFRGSITKQQAIEYAFLSRYPKQWFSNEA
jgi:hypothetical protein